MRKGLSNVIMLVVAVLVAGAVIVIGFNMLKGVIGGYQELQGKGKEFSGQLENAMTLKDACERWLSSADMYDANKILNDFKIPQAFQPFTGIYDLCGKALGDTARLCANPDNQGVASYDEKCKDGMVKPNVEEVQKCMAACKQVIQIADTYCSNCGDETKNNLCFVQFLNFLGNHLDCNEYTLQILTNSDVVQKACAGQLFQKACLGVNFDGGYNLCGEEKNFNIPVGVTIKVNGPGDSTATYTCNEDGSVTKG